MDGSTRQSGGRTLTPAVLASALFTVACAAFAVTFVAARGGLQLPVAPGGSQAAISSPIGSPAPTAAPATSAPTSGPRATPTPVPTQPAPPTPTPPPSAAPTDLEDPLAALPGCADHPGCFEYTVRRGDTLSGVASRYAIPVWVVLALNPGVTDPSTIVIGQTLYLGRQPYVRLDPCGGEAIDCYLYVVRPGDALSTIAGRYGLTVEAILDANPEIPSANTIYSGQVIRLQFRHGVI